jgi:hypothetical protein
VPVGCGRVHRRCVARPSPDDAQTTYANRKSRSRRGLRAPTDCGGLPGRQLGGRFARSGDDVRDDIAELGVAVLRGDAQDLERALGVAAFLGHQDALGLVDHRAGGQRGLEVVQQLDLLGQPLATSNAPAA